MAVTISPETRKKLLEDAVYAALLAAEEVRKIYHTGQYEVNMRSDFAPVTVADRKAHEIIKKTLLPTRIPLLSEDGRAFHYDERQAWDLLWMVDPLDGTREFVKPSPEFSVNVALVENSRPSVGVIVLPELQTLYFALKDEGAYRKSHINFQGTREECAFEELLKKANRLPLPETDRDYLVVSSLTNRADSLTPYIEKLRAEYPKLKWETKGSSLKMCLVAEGSADAYPRLSNTSEWDIAAGQIIVEEAGRQVVSLDAFETLRYNKPNLKNPPFIVKRKEDTKIPRYETKHGRKLF